MTHGTICRHPHPKSGPEGPYFGDVSQHPYTDTNSRAHGGVCIIETCSDCGLKRKVNENGPWTEFGPWTSPLTGNPW